MRIQILKSKIHRATITSCDLQYQGSLTLDKDLMAAAQIHPFEKVQIVNVNNGARLETYAIGGARASGIVQLNGAAARCGQPGDLIIVLTYAEVDDSELVGYQPVILHVTEANHPLANELTVEALPSMS